MPRLFRCVVPLAISLGLLLPGAAAQAQLARTFVSSVNGNDANDCGRATPCRTFQRAHDNTLATGEIAVLDPGGYGAVTITKAIGIVNDGVGEAGMLVSGGGTGILINAGVNDAITLRGLTVKGLGRAFGAGIGIVFEIARLLTIENCVIRGQTNIGIDFRSSVSTTFAMSNTIVADNGDAGIVIRQFGTPGNAVNAVFNRVELHNNRFSLGFDSTGSISAVVVDSIVAGNSETGISTRSRAGAAASLVVARSIIANNGVGLSGENTNTTIRISQSIVTGNTTSWSVADGAVLQSYGDNNINGNADGSPAPPVIARK